MSKLKPLKKGDLIAIAAPAGPFERSDFLKGVSLIERVPFRVAYWKGIFSRSRLLPYLAGDDHRRSEELLHHLSDPESKALLIARGGFGTQRLLPLLPKKCEPKVVVGSSDLTVLLNCLWKKYGLPSYYGPMVAPHLYRRENASRLGRALTDPSFFKRQRLMAKEVIKPGKGEGTLIGGCLSLVVSTIGTPWEFETKGSLLFLEDTNESPYMVDRMLTQLEQAGKFKSVRGLILGTFRLGKTFFPPEILAVFRERFRDFPGPILWGMCFGHHPRPLLMPFGGRGRIEGRELIITQGIFS